VRFPPITNATLTRVQPGGGAEDYDATTLSGADKFTGSQAAFVSDEQVSRDAGGTSTIVLERSVAVDDALAVDWARGDTLTYTYRGDTLTGVVRDIKTTTAPGLPGVIRLVLRDG
jgi:hypothetical protein